MLRQLYRPLLLRIPLQMQMRRVLLPMTWNRTAIVAAIPVAAVAVIAGVVSYSHIEALGLMTGQSLADARLLPLAVDGLIVAGSVILLAGSWLGWIGVSLGVAGTLYANVMSGLPRGPLAAAVAAWPAVAFTVASFMLERWLKSQAAVPETGPEPDMPATPAATPVAPEDDTNGSPASLLSPRMTNLDLAELEGVSVRTIQRRRKKVAANGHVPSR